MDQSMKLGEVVSDFVVPPHPKGTILDGKHVRLEPVLTQVHASDLFAANTTDQGAANWAYLPYGPFADIESYRQWLSAQEGGEDPHFYAIVRKSDQKAVGVASYLRINPEAGSIEVGHINYSPLLQQTIEGTEAMYLMMKWAFESGYRRYEWKCNALNLKSRAAAQRLGLSYEGVFRQAVIIKGRNRATAWFAAIDKEWAALKKCFDEYLSDDNISEDGRAKTPLSTLTKPILFKIDDLELS